MARYLDPKADLTFKRIFGEHPELLISFLNALLPFEPGRQIVSIEYLPSEQPPQTAKGKNSIVDVRCKDNHKRIFIVEMQMFWQKHFFRRLILNASKSYVRQLMQGDDHDLLHPVYTLAIINENFDDSDDFYHHYKVMNCNNTVKTLPDYEFIMVELTEKFRPETITDRKLMVLWLRFLYETGERMRKLPPEMQKNKHIAQAAQLCEEGAFTPEELAQYEGYWDCMSRQKAELKNAMEKGEEIGLQKGRTERDQLKEQVVIKSHQAGMSIELISTITDLTIEEINTILQRN
jgi:predicted transposase/invertase (TIGR01784 family)